MATNFEFQQLAYDKFAKLKVGALFMKMGSGKTKVAVDLINNAPDYVDRVLWVCPNQVKASTIKELKKWSPRCRFRVIAYESLSQSQRIFDDAKDYAKTGRTFLVLDESIFVKNGESMRWQRCKAIRILCPYCIILNGTPIQKDEWDLYWQMNMLDERIIPYNKYDFERLFFDKTRINKGRYHFTKLNFSQKNAQVLAKYIEPYTFQIDVDYGIAKSDKTIKVTPTAQTLSDYEDVRQEAIEGLKTSLYSFMGKLGELCEIAACDDNRIKETAKLAKGKPVIVYAKYRREIWKLQKAIGECYVINGETKAEQRRTQLNLFEIMQDRPLILSFGTGSYGLNLQYANKVIFNSYDWNYGTLEQAKARVLRIGQKQAVQFTFVEIELKIQELLKRCVSTKTDIAEFVKSKLMEGKNYELYL